MIEHVLGKIGNIVGKMEKKYNNYSHFGRRGLFSYIHKYHDLENLLICV